MPANHLKLMDDDAVKAKKTPNALESNARRLKVRRDQKLWESDQFMEMFFAHCVEGIWFMEADEPFLWNDDVDKEAALDYAFSHQHIVRVNDAMLKQYDATIDQFMGLTLNDFFAHDLKTARALWRKVFDAGTLTMETKEHRFAGREIFAGEDVWFLGDYFCIYNDEGKMVGHFGAQRDITIRKQMEQALRESEERYRSLAKNVADGIMVVQDDRLLVINDAFLSMFGYSDRRQLVGKRVIELFSDDLRESYSKMKGLLETVDMDLKSNGHRDTAISQGVCFSRDGRQFWVEAHTSPIKWKGRPALLSALRDITERKLAEIAAREKADDLYKENIKLRSSIKDRYRFCNIIGKSAAMQKVYELIIRAANSSANVIIYGESGTGKELVAQAIHNMSHRSDKAFVPVNCHAIPESLLESEFFGHKKGAFTGAYKDQPGFLKMADGGDLFLDEVGDLHLSMQGKLLRAIEGGGFSPVGGAALCKSDFRIIAATNKNMADAVKKGTMREDFYYRIHIIPIVLPPLRERKEDIPLLIDYYLSSFAGEGQFLTMPGRILETLYNYDWPGNVRELQNVVQRFLAIGNIDFLKGEHRRSVIKPPAHKPDEVDEPPSDQSYKEAVESFEKKLIINALNRHNWNRNRVIDDIGIPRRTLYQKMKNYGLL